MKARYDDTEITLTDDFISALVALMKAECAMMREQDAMNAECWTWGRCRVGNIAERDGLSFEYGGDIDLPNDGRCAFAVVTEEPTR